MDYNAIPYENYIDFYCGGKSIGFETSYYVFYYCENYLADAMQNVNYPEGETLKSDDNGYSWKEIGGDNKFYAEKLQMGFTIMRTIIDAICIIN